MRPCGSGAAQSISRCASPVFAVSREKVYLFVLTNETTGQTERVVIRAYPLSINSAELSRLTENLRDSVAELGDFREQARQAYDLLLKPADEQLNGKHEICIVPDGVLWDLPFQALLTARNKFLLEEHAVSYASSLNVLREIVRKQQQRDKKTSSASLLALGNPFVAGERSTSLPEAETEIKALNAIYGRAKSKILIGKEAREDIAKTGAAKFDILHFAAHGILDNNNPLYSHLDLANGGTNEDGLLEAREIMRLNLTADLAVLSACETARGKIRAGEGMIGMAWAFAAAGVPATVVSQWNIDSASAAALMVDFHKSLADGQRKSKAASLREAALKLMHEPRYKHPFYWASFVLVGSSRYVPRLCPF